MSARQLFRLQTFSLGTVVILLGEEFLVLHQVKLVPGVEFSVAEDAHEAVHVIDIVLGSPDHRAGRDPLPAAGALGAVLPEEILPAEDLIVLDETFLPERLGTHSAAQTLGVPGLVHNLQDEPVQYHPSAGATLRYGGYN